MSTNPKSRWAEDDEQTALAEAQRKREKEEKKRIKAEKQRQIEESEKTRGEALAASARQPESINGTNGYAERPTKRRRLSQDADQHSDNEPKVLKLLRFPTAEWGPCRHVDNFEKLNHIEEGSYGWVSRARESSSGEVVALKKLKMENSAEGFPVTGLREIQTLLEARHPNIVHLREIVMGDSRNDVFLVMDFLEHDLKTLLSSLSEPFLPSETKTLLLQLTSAMDFLHTHWILHRDLKTSNILLNNRGQIKLADFGMARFYGSPPPPNLTPLVTTLWYRAPELLLGAKTYGAEIDVWSIGCIFAELLTNNPLLQGTNEVTQLSQIFSLLGVPTSQSWPGFRSLPHTRSLRLPSYSPPSSLRAKFPYLTTHGAALLASLLSMNPSSRPDTAEILKHPYFKEDPKPKRQEMFPTFPSKAGMEKRRKIRTPDAPKRGEAAGLGEQLVDFSGLFSEAGGGSVEGGAGFALKMG